MDHEAWGMPTPLALVIVFMSPHLGSASVPSEFEDSLSGSAWFRALQLAEDKKL